MDRFETTMHNLKDDEIRQAVRETYGAIAQTGTPGCGCSSDCCDMNSAATPEEVSVGIGYSDEDVSNVPEGANMGLGCGNPQAIASLQIGETVLDLGSGDGSDCFLSARAVGETGHVIGVDMTPEMITKARQNAVKAGLDNAEFRLGEIEHLPVADNSVDVLISNGAINLSPDKAGVFREIFRVLNSGGRLAVADIVALAPMPEEIKNDIALHSGCVAGALQVGELERILNETGFIDVRIRLLNTSKEIIQQWIPDRNIEDFIASAYIEAVKP